MWMELNSTHSYHASTGAIANDCKKEIWFEKQLVGDGRGQNKEAYDTEYSQAFTHQSTNPARHSLTLVIEREPFFFFYF